MYIYQTTNLINGKTYVGQSKRQIELSKEYLGSGNILKSAVKKYGKENFKKEILCECISEEELNSQERFFIRKLKPEYNISPGGQNGFKLGKDNPNVKVRKIGKLNPFFGRKHTKKTKEKIARKNKRFAGKSNPNYGKKWSEEQKQEASVRQKDNHKHLRGDASPSKRKSVRKLLSKTKLGILNPNAKEWIFIDPTGKIHEIHGGIKTKLKEFGLSYVMFFHGIPGNQMSKKHNARLYWKETFEAIQRGEVKDVRDQQG